jgi:ribosomal protein S18 acetylase RimI-like enzyme
MDLQPGQFGQYEMRHRTEDKGERKPRNIVEAVHEGKPVGSLTWRGTSGVVDMIKVDPEHQRRGVATAMWDHAQSLKGIRKPRDNGDFTDAGRAWAKARRSR